MAAHASATVGDHPAHRIAIADRGRSGKKDRLVRRVLPSPYATQRVPGPPRCERVIVAPELSKALYLPLSDPGEEEKVNFMPLKATVPARRLSRRAFALAAGAVVGTAVTRGPGLSARTTPVATPAAPVGTATADAPTAPAPLPMPGTLAADASPEFRAVAEALVDAMQQYRVPGTALGILAGGREEHATFGVVSQSSLVPVGPDTLFQIGSLTRTFTATAIWHLIDEGVLALDAPVRTYLPAFRLADEEVAASATIANLLDHTGGWLGDIMPGDPGDDGSVARYVDDAFPTLPQIFPLGEFFSYNNAGFILHGRLIEAVTGTTYDAAMGNLIFGPLGLSATVLDHAEVRRRPYADGHVAQPINGRDALAVLTPCRRRASPGSSGTRLHWPTARQGSETVSAGPWIPPTRHTSFKLGRIPMSWWRPSPTTRHHR